MSRRRQGGFNETQSPYLVNVDHLLPLPLQDVCLLRVVSDLDCYPIELLESLPRWLRYRLLNNLPALDLCHLDHSAVARGVDVNQLWETRKKPPAERRVAQHNTTSAASVQSLFQLDVSVRQESNTPRLRRLRYPPQAECSPALREKISLAFNDVNKQPGTEVASAREEYLSSIVSNVLFHSPSLDVVSRLISIPGEHLLLNLLVASHHKSVTPRHNYGVWMKQATALKVQPVGIPPLPHRPSRHPGHMAKPTLPWPSHYDARVVLTPHRLVSISDENVGITLQLLTLLVNHCGVQPTSINIHIDKMSREILHALYMARVAQDSGFNITSHCTTCVSIMHHFLRRVIILKLQCDKYAEIGVMIEMIEAATADGEHCQLKYLFCTLPDVYLGIVQPLSTVFSLQNFSQLSLEVDDVYLLSLSKLLFAFMTVPCPNTQQLCIHIKGKTMHPSKALDIAGLATFDMKGETVPHCAIQHKVLEILPNYEFSRMLCILLQWPTIRLNKIVLGGNCEYEYLHLCALHPDLQVIKLVIIIDEKANEVLLNTVQEDLVALLQLPTLQEFTIMAFWGLYKEAKAGLVQGLHQRSSLPPLRKIYINEATPGGFSEEEYRGLWNAIFSLPQLGQLEIVLSVVAVGVIFKHLNTVFECWVETASGIQLKAIHFESIATDRSSDEIKLMSHLAQTYSFLSVDDLFNPDNNP